MFDSYNESPNTRPEIVTRPLLIGICAAGMYRENFMTDACTAPLALTSHFYTYLYTFPQDCPKKQRLISSRTFKRANPYEPSLANPSNLCSKPFPRPSLSHSPSDNKLPFFSTDLAGNSLDSGTGLIETCGDTVPGRWSGESVPDVMSVKGVTVVGTERRRSLYDMKEIRRLSFWGVRCAAACGSAGA